MRLHPTRCRRHLVETKPFVQNPAGEALVTCTLVPDLIPPAKMDRHPLLYMPFDFSKRLSAIAVMKVAHPAPEGSVDLFYDLVKRLWRHAPMCHDGDAVLDLPGTIGVKSLVLTSRYLPGILAPWPDRCAFNTPALCTTSPAGETNEKTSSRTMQIGIAFSAS